MQLAGGLEEGEATTRQWVTMEAEGSQGAWGTVGHCTSVAGNSGSWEALWKVNGSAAGWRLGRGGSCTLAVEHARWLRATSLGPVHTGIKVE